MNNTINDNKNYEQIRANEIVGKMMMYDRFSQWLGINVVSVTFGKCTLQMLVRDEMLNGFDILHGGISYSLADTALAFAANSCGIVAVSLNQSMSYPAAAKVDDVLTAIANEVSRTSKTAIYDVTITNQENKTIGLFRGTVYITSKNH